MNWNLAVVLRTRSENWSLGTIGGSIFLRVFPGNIISENVYSTINTRVSSKPSRLGGVRYDEHKTATKERHLFLADETN
jgi:hypothetical protein